MCTFLSTHASALQGLRVLELGAGTGLAGLCAAGCGAACTVLTDLPEALTLLEANIALNQPNQPAHAPLVNPVFACSYGWGDSPDEVLTFPLSRCQSQTLSQLHDHAQGVPGGLGFDVLICSDLIYEPVAAQLLGRALGDLLGPNAVAIFGWRCRRPDVPELVMEALEGFCVQPLVANGVLHPSPFVPCDATGDTALNTELVFDALRVIGDPNDSDPNLLQALNPNNPDNPTLLNNPNDANNPNNHGNPNKPDIDWDLHVSDECWNDPSNNPNNPDNPDNPDNSNNFNQKDAKTKQANSNDPSDPNGPNNPFSEEVSVR